MKVPTNLKWAIVGGIALLIGTLAYLHENVPLGHAMLALVIMSVAVVLTTGQKAEDGSTTK